MCTCNCAKNVLSTRDLFLLQLVKATLDVPRPHTSKKSSPGMPSTHAIAWTYFAVAVHSFARNNRYTCKNDDLI